MPIESAPSHRARASAMLIALLCSAYLSGCSGQETPRYEGPYKHVLFVSLDTVRADQIGCYGGEQAKTPSIDGVAREGVRFAQVTAAASTTLHSHTSMMTGLYGRRHGVVRNGFMVPRENVMLAEVLAEQGFHTAAVIGSFALDRMFDFNQGFAHFDQEFDIEFSPLLADQNQRRAEQVTDAALAHLDEIGEVERLFLFTHYFDAHAAYDPPSPFAEEYALPGGPTASDMQMLSTQVVKHQQRSTGKVRDVFNLGLSKGLARDVDGEPIAGDAELAALYAGELAYLDHHLGRLLEGLDKRGYLEDCLVVIVSDHGETFWEHGDFWHHGAWVYETNVHVPMILRLPDGRGRAGVVEDPVSGTDLFPTLLDLLEIPLPEPVDGISLAAAVDGAALPERPIFSEGTQPITNVEHLFKWGGQLKPKSIRLGKWKYIQAPYLRGVRLEELFDLEADPGERVNLAIHPTAESPAQLKRLLGRLDEWREVEDPRTAVFNPTQSQAVLDRLKALGYTGKGELQDEAEDGE